MVNPVLLPMPATDGPGWTRVWSCDFTQGAVPLGGFTTQSSTWGQLKTPYAYASLISAYPSAWKDTSKKGSYNITKTAFVSNNTLKIKPISDATNSYVCAIQPVTAALRYGKYTERWRVQNPGNAFKFALLMWPQDEIWPGHGEIDWPEFDDFTGKVKAAVARPQASVQFDVTWGAAIADGAWHTTTTEITATGVRCWLDGVLFSSVPTIMPAPMRRVWQIETAINSTPVDKLQSPTVEFDWMTIAKVG